MGSKLYNKVNSVLSEFGSEYTLTRTSNSVYDPITDTFTNNDTITETIIGVLKTSKTIIESGVIYEKIEFLTQYPILVNDKINDNFIVQSVSEFSLKGEQIIYKCIQLTPKN